MDWGGGITSFLGSLCTGLKLMLIPGTQFSKSGGLNVKCQKAGVLPQGVGTLGQPVINSPDLKCADVRHT